MALQLHLTATADRHVEARLANSAEPLVPPTPLDNLTRIEGDSNPYRIDPFGLGATLWAAMGGPALLEHLEQDADKLLLLVTDDETAALPWEYVATSDRRFLALRYGLLRLLPDAPPTAVDTSGPLTLTMLAADPLVDKNGRPILHRTRFNPDPEPDEIKPRLDIDKELQAIGEVVQRSNRTLSAKRIPPTIEALQESLTGPPALLHLSCHGTVIEQEHNGQVSRQPMLYLEDDSGQEVSLRGDRLANYNSSFTKSTNPSSRKG